MTTISISLVTDDMTGFMNQVVYYSRDTDEASEAAKALYQIVSTGHDGADGMKILEKSPQGRRLMV